MFSLDYDIITELKIRKINASAIVNEFLKGYLELKEDSIENQDLDNELNKTRARLVKLEAEKNKMDKIHKEKVEKGLIIEC